MNKIQDDINKYILVRPRYKQLAQKISIILQEVLEIEGINYHAVNFRAKEIESFADKVENPKYNDPLNQITDLAGIRVIAYVEDDVIKIRSIIEKLFTIDPANSLDKSEELGTDKVGYKSVHYICELPENRTVLLEYSRFKQLRFEIQVRTILQHSWAEIEHDKNYKFSGELPKEIKRRFKLLAGSLEIADREFNQLSKEIDKYSIEVKEKTERGELDILINSTSLKQYMITKFESAITKEVVEPTFHSSAYESVIIRELNNFGLKTLNDLNKIIPDDFISVIEHMNYHTNFLGILRNILLISNYENYFEKCYKNDWDDIIPDEDFMFSHYNIDPLEIATKLNEVNQKKYA